MDEFKRMPDLLDVTEVEKTRLHEDGETKRKQIEEVELTTRTKSDNRKSLLTNNGFITGTAIAVVVVATALMSSYIYYTSCKYPTPTIVKADPCIESLETVRPGAKISCAAGAVLESKPITNSQDVEIHCKCPQSK